MLHEGDYTGALDIISTLETEHFNSVELNYYTFYEIYAAYLKDGFLSEYNKISLRYLAALCPGKEGSVVYQAAALYNSIYSEIVYQDCAEGSGAKIADLGNEKKSTLQEGGWNVEVFPNPANQQLSIKTKRENEYLNIVIRDLSGRMVLNKELQVKGFIATLEMELINGAYLIFITNSYNEKTIKKLLISK